jgi:zinc/manganese transport system substrate-binding protein
MTWARRAAALVALGLAAGARAAGPGEPPPLRVVTLSTVLSEIAREVGGDGVEVTGLVQPGVDPHTFNPSPADIRAVVDADIVLASGLGLEAYLGRLVRNAGPRVRVVAVGDSVPVVLEGPRAGGEKDPHWWLCIDDMLFAADMVRSEFSRARPSGAAAFGRNARAYERRLSALKDWVAREVSALPPERRHLVTSHDAFGYFAHDYGFSVHPVVGLSTDSEADARRVAALVDVIRKEDIRAVFAESSANPRIVRDLLDETGARLGGTLYADGLGPAGSGADTYEAMVKLDVRAIVDALGAPGG